MFLAASLPLQPTRSPNTDLHCHTTVNTGGEIVHPAMIPIFTCCHPVVKSAFVKEVWTSWKYSIISPLIMSQTPDYRSASHSGPYGAKPNVLTKSIHSICKFDLFCQLKLVLNHICMLQTPRKVHLLFFLQKVSKILFLSNWFKQLISL